MTKIGIQNPNLIVTNDYQQFLMHFEWFLEAIISCPYAGLGHCPEGQGPDTV